MTRYFCPTCGSPLAFVGERWPGEIHLYAGSLEKPDDIEPRGHVHVAEQLRWADLHDELPRFSTLSKAGGPIRKGPKLTT